MRHGSGELKSSISEVGFSTYATFLWKECGVTEVIIRVSVPVPHFSV
jgi:hypothetical protein